MLMILLYVQYLSNHCKHVQVGKKKKEKEKKKSNKNNILSQI